jgi:hypothetical protein
LNLDFNMLLNQVSHHMRMRRFGKQLKLKVDNTKAMKKSDVLLFMCLRNELFRLPYFVEYYRKLGVNHFLVIDNNSDDGFLDWARQQPDISVWHTEAGYKAANFGMEWCNFLLGKYGTGHLCVTVDPDEFLVYPCMETRNLRELGEYMKMEKREAFHVVMLDAYSDKPLAETIYRQGDNPWDVAPFFDKDGYVQVSTHVSPAFTRGGPRMRLYHRQDPRNAPALNKIPVVWWRSGFRYVSSMHDIRPTRLTQLERRFPPTPSGALFHFKFFATLNEKAAEEMQRKQHYYGGTEYERYAKESMINFHEPGVSVKYESPDQLIQLGLMCRGRWI